MMGAIIFFAGRCLYLIAIEIAEQSKIRGASVVTVRALLQPVRRDMHRDALRTVFHQKSNVMGVGDGYGEASWHQRQTMPPEAAASEQSRNDALAKYSSMSD